MAPFEVPSILRKVQRRKGKGSARSDKIELRIRVDSPSKLLRERSALSLEGLSDGKETIGPEFELLGNVFEDAVDGSSRINVTSFCRGEESLPEVEGDVGDTDDGGGFEVGENPGKETIGRESRSVRCMTADEKREKKKELT